MNLPLALGIVVAAAAGALLLLAFIRRTANGPLLKEPARAPPMITIAGTAFAVLLAFVTLAAFQTYNGAKRGAESEAVAVLEMFRTAALFPASSATSSAPASSATEGPSPTRSGRRCVPAVAVRWSITGSPTTAISSTGSISAARERLGFQAVLAEASQRTDGRRERLSQVTPSVPSPLWLVLVLGACVTVALQLGMADRRERLFVQGAMIGAVATILTAGLLLVNFLDHPYQRHAGSIKPTEMRQSLAMMHGTAPGLATPLPPDGIPLT